MPRAALLAAVVFGAIACSSKPAPGPELQIVGDSVKVREGEPFPRASAIFDGQTVRLRGARGETLGVQVLMKRPEPVSIELAGARVTPFTVRSLDVKEASTGMYGPSRGRGRYPDILDPAGDAPTFFDVLIPADIAPGLHTGKLQVGARSFPVELRVEPVRIDPAAEPLVWVFYEPKHLPGGAEAEAAFAALFRAHGAYIAGDGGPEMARAHRPMQQGVQYWPVSLQVQDIENSARAFAEVFAGTGVKPFAIPIDEPRTSEQRRKVRQIGEAVDRSGADFLLAVTAAPHADFGDAVDLYISPDAVPPHHATYNGRPPQAGSMIIDTDGGALRTWGWIAYRYDVDLWYAWHGLYFTDRYNDGVATDVMNDPLSFDQRPKGEDYGNGDGLLAYPGALPSLRLKALRRGLQDRLLLLELARCDERAARNLAKQTIPRALAEARGKPSWPRDEVAWEGARHLIFDMLAERCRRP